MDPFSQVKRKPWRGDLLNIGQRTQYHHYCLTLPLPKDKSVITSPGKERLWKKIGSAISKATYYLGAKGHNIFGASNSSECQSISSAHQILRLRLLERTKI